MTQLLSYEECNRLKAKVARLSVVSNASLVVTKFVVGSLTGSVSIISEALHSGNDLIAAALAYYAVRKASVPADNDHPFGHGKFESVSGALEALLIFAVAIGIIYSSVHRILHGIPKVEMLGWGLAVMLLSVMLNFFVSQKLIQVSKMTGSIALEADGWHLRTDVYTSLGVLAGICLIMITKINWLDPIIAISVALLIVKAAYGITREALGNLLDAAIPEAEQKEIYDLIAEHYPLALGIHELRTRRVGSTRYVDLHLEVLPDVHVDKAHALCDDLEGDIRKILPGTSVLIHIEPSNDPKAKDTVRL